MLNWIKRICAITVICMSLSVLPACNSYKDDYHESDYDQWLIEQVQTGHMTQDEADMIREEWKLLRNE